jgi:hypothetical protein
MSILYSILKFINYWLVPHNYSKQERLKRVFEVGVCIGMLMSFIAFMGYLLIAT